MDHSVMLSAWAGVCPSARSLTRLERSINESTGANIHSREIEQDAVRLVRETVQRHGTADLQMVAGDQGVEAHYLQDFLRDGETFDDPAIAGVIIRSDKKTAIMVDASLPWERQLIVFAQALSHVVYQDFAYAEPGWAVIKVDRGTPEPAEQRAERFATALLHELKGGLN